MNRLMLSSWKAAAEQEEESVVGISLLRMFGLVEKVGGGRCRLVHSLDVTEAVLLHLHTEYLYRDLGIAREECDAQEKRAISLLHKYNKTKDAAQDILGLLARAKGVTVRQMMEEYDAPQD